mgnify:CR=1 FL=1
MGFLPALALLFIALKLTGFVMWSWVWVLSPIWIWFLLIVVFAAWAVLSPQSFLSVMGKNKR